MTVRKILHRHKLVLPLSRKNDHVSHCMISFTNMTAMKQDNNLIVSRINSKAQFEFHQFFFKFITKNKNKPLFLCTKTVSGDVMSNVLIQCGCLFR